MATINENPPAGCSACSGSLRQHRIFPPHCGSHGAFWLCPPCLKRHLHGMKTGKNGTFTVKDGRAYIHARPSCLLSRSLESAGILCFGLNHLGLCGYRHRYLKMFYKLVIAFFAEVQTVYLSVFFRKNSPQVQAAENTPSFTISPEPS